MPLLVTVTIPSLTNLPADSVTNQWAIATTELPSAAEMDSIQAAIRDFYTVVDAGSARTVGQYLSQQMSRVANACQIKVYDITGHEAGTPHGSPIDASSFTLPAVVGGSAMPSEVACVLRLEAEGRATALVEAVDGADADLAVDRPRQRRTGRVFIGPLTTSAVFVVTNVPRVDPSLIETLNGRAVSTHDTIKALSPDIRLGVWSRKDAIVRPLESVAVDNAFDTQRRRGEKASALTRELVIP